MEVNKNYWQTIRGLCIAMVVLIHCLGEGRIIDWIIIRKIINFCVPVFIFMAAYFIDVDKITSKDFSYKKFLLSRGGYRLLIPYLVWSTFYILIDIAKLIIKKKEINYLHYLVFYLTGEACTPLYYLVVLIQLTIITPFLVRIIKSNNKKTMILLWFITPIWLVYVYAWNIIYGVEPYLFGTLFPCWFIFYYLGLRVKCGMKFESIPIIVLLTLIISIVESLFFNSIGVENLRITAITFGTYSYSIALIGLFLKYKNTNFKENILSKLGDLSYGIYFIHIFILMFINKFVSILNINSWYLSWIIKYALTLSISALAVYIIQQLFKHNKTFLKLIGMK